MKHEKKNKTTENGTKMKKYLAYAFGGGGGGGGREWANTEQIHIHSFVFIRSYMHENFYKYKKEKWCALRRTEISAANRSISISDVAIRPNQRHTHTHRETHSHKDTRTHSIQFGSSNNLENSRIVANRIHIQAAFQRTTEQTKPIYTHSKMTSTFQNAQQQKRKR